MKVNKYKNDKITIFNELKVGEPFYISGISIEARALYMKTDEANDSFSLVKRIVNAVNIESGSLASFEQLQKVERANVYVEHDKE